MKISSIKVSNFRALEDVQVPFHDYTTFIGPNGAGKSTFLYALDWFFGNRNISKDDLTNRSQATEITVSVTFESLSQRDKEKLGTFVNEDRASFKRALNVETGQISYTGMARLGPGFDGVLSGTLVSQFRPAYKELRQTNPNLPELDGNFSLDQVRVAFHDWINDPVNAGAVETCEQAADSLFVTPGCLDDLCQFILIKGSLDLASETHTTAKGSLLSVLTNSLIDSARNQTIKDWRMENEEAIAALRSSTRDAVHLAIDKSTNDINSYLTRYVPRSTVVLESTDPEVDVRYPTAITASIRGADGSTLPISNQGHGLQRAVAMSMIQALYADADGHDDQATRTVILAAEEPEIYQHPVRARAFAQSLKKLAEKDNFQVALATHSPSFVSSDFMDSLRFTRMLNGITCVRHSSVERLATIRGHSVARTREWLSKEVPRAFADAFFADLVVLVEGVTDEWIIPELADLLGTPFEQLGIVSVNAEGKTSVFQYKALLEEFGLPTFAIFDGDYCDDDPDAASDKKVSCKQQTIDCVQSLGLHDKDDSPRYRYGDQSTVLDNAAVFQRKIEHELNQWPSFQLAMAQVNKQSAAKNAYRYRTAARSADAEDMPDFLRRLVKQIIQSSMPKQDWYEQP